MRTGKAKTCSVGKRQVPVPLPTRYHAIYQNHLGKMKMLRLCICHVMFREQLLYTATMLQGCRTTVTSTADTRFVIESTNFRCHTTLFRLFLSRDRVTALRSLASTEQKQFPPPRAASTPLVYLRPDIFRPVSLSGFVRIR